MHRGRPFLFGKLPTLGDFVGRGLRAMQRDAWDDRCTAALSDARRRLGVEFDAALEVTPPHAFLLAPTVAENVWQAGCVAPSCDRAGRPFLFVVGVADADGWGERAGRIAARLEPCLCAAISQGLAVDAILAAVADLFNGAGEERDDDEAGRLNVMLGWRTDWIGVPAISDAREDAREREE
jgi:type VI secretion system protein ImpM